MSKQKIKHGFLTLRFALEERLYDFLNILFPIFLVTGILVACFKFWWWVFI